VARATIRKENAAVRHAGTFIIAKLHGFFFTAPYRI
jgi:hypothetical protein